ncbi:MAG: two-component system, OmpR family, sensor histidine kinase PrrB [Thermoleophilaceae bacterium]|nr:two-component system, OmpR family, sensor histidine kinase PrrB [Thermoleophilaceae bacterium]
MRSLRGRLTLGVTLVLAVILGVSGTLVSRYVDRSERGALDERLERTADLSQATALAAIEQQLPPGDRRLDAVLSATTTSLRLLLGDTVLLQTGRALPPHRAEPGLRTLTIAGKRYRVFVAELRDAGLGGLVKLEVATTLGPLEQRQDRLNRRLAYLGLAALVIAGLGTWLFADLALRPLRRLRRVTTRIAEEEDLDRTVPADDGPAEIRAVARSFNGMLSRLGRSAADRRRALDATRRFAADAGHELRTPLTSVQATLSTIARHPGLDAERRTALVEDALAEQRRLVDLLDGLQALARGDAAPGESGDVDLADLVATVVADTARRGGGVDLVSRLPDGPVVVRGWEAGLRVLVGNLDQNAVRHGRPGGRAEVVLTAGDVPRLTVDDDGPGIPEDARERVFEPFTRLGTGAPGSGLGLTLVAQQAGLHGASVVVEDSPLGGARFVVTWGGG